MRPKVVLTLLFCALLVIGAALILKPHAAKTAAPAPVETAAPPVPETASAVPAVPAPMPIAPGALTVEERQNAIEAEVEHLQDLSRNDDPQSLSNILADLTSPEKEVRQAAIEATKQFGSTNAIPVLKAAAMNSTDTEDQMAMLDAANFLSLTPINDPGVQQPLTPEQLQADAQRNAQHEAQHQAQMQGQSSQNQGLNQNPPPAPGQTGVN